MTWTGACIGAFIGGILGAVRGDTIGFFIGIISGGFVGACIGESIGNDEAASGAGDSAGDDELPPLKLRIRKIKMTSDDGTQEDVLEASFKGTIFAPANNTRVKFVLYADDCTSGKENGEPLGTTLEELSSTQNGLLSPARDDTLPYEASNMKEWAPLFAIPVEYVNFPYRGNRNIEFTLFVEDMQGNALDAATCNHHINVPEIGYLEIDNLKAEKKAVQIAVMLAKKNSGLVTLETIQIIKDWIAGVAVSDEEDDKRKVRSELNQTLNFSINSRIEINSSTTFSSEAKKMEAVQPTAGKYNIMEFLLRVAASFEEVKASDIKVLDAIAKELQLENDEYQAAKHKYLPVDGLGDADPFVVLSIPNSLTKSEKKAKILELFQKWNALATHKEPAMREKAEKMLDCIAKCRERLR